jgi:hypothetical protein
VPRMIRGGRTLLRRRASSASSDRGAAATLVAVLLGGGVLLGMTALVVDVGQLYAEREELQSTADSTAMAIALDCAFDRDGCDEAQLPATAAHYAEGNVRDNLAEVFVCGSDERLPDCDEPPFEPRGNLTDCLGERPEDGTAYVEVRTSTLKAGGSTLLPPSFAQTLVSGHQGTTVGACARVAYGGPAVSLAMTISDCEWDHATQGNTHYPNPDPSWDDAQLKAYLLDYDVTLVFKDPHAEADDDPDPGEEHCQPGPSGYDAPGAFGWLRDFEDSCSTEIEDDTYRGRGGDRVSAVCRGALDDAIANATPLIFPVYKDVTGSGANIEYTFRALVAFVPTGYTLSGGGGGGIQHPSVLTGDNVCHASESCISGYFVEVVDSTDIGPLPGFGLTVVRTIG